MLCGPEKSIHARETGDQLVLGEAQIDSKESEKEFETILSQTDDTLIRNRNAVLQGCPRQIRLVHGLTKKHWDLLELTFINVDAKEGEYGNCFLIQGFKLSNEDRARIINILDFESAAKFCLLEYVVAMNNNVTFDYWRRLVLVMIVPRNGLELKHSDIKRRKYSLSGKRQTDAGKYSCLTLSREVGELYYLSLQEYGVIEEGTAPSTTLSQYSLDCCSFPGDDMVNLARKHCLKKIEDLELQALFSARQIWGGSKFLEKIETFTQVSDILRSTIEFAISCTKQEPMIELLHHIICTDSMDRKRKAGDAIKSEVIPQNTQRRKQLAVSSKAGVTIEGSKTEEYLKERAEKAEQEARLKDIEVERLREQLAALKTEEARTLDNERSSPSAKERAEKAEQEARLKDIEVERLREQLAAVKTEGARTLDNERSSPSSDTESIDSEERERILDEIIIDEYGSHENYERAYRRFSQRMEHVHFGAFREFRNTYRSMREKRDIQIEFSVWLHVFIFACYFAAMEYGAAYIHDHELIPTLDDPRMRGNDILIYVGIFLCTFVMLASFALNVPTACDWFYGLVIMPATRLCFASNQGYASMIAIILLCSQKRKWLLALEFLCVISFIIFAPLAYRFVFVLRLILTLVLYQNRIVNHVHYRTPTLFLSVWRDIILTTIFMAHWIIEHVQLFFCACGGH